MLLSVGRKRDQKKSQLIYLGMNKKVKRLVFEPSGNVISWWVHHRLYQCTCLILEGFSK